AGGQLVGLGELGLARVAASERAALREQLRACRPMDGAIAASPTPQAAVGGGDDGVRLEGGYVGDDDLDPGGPNAPSQRSGRHACSCTSLGGEIAGQIADFALEIASMAFPAADAITSQWIRPARPSRRRSTTTSCASTRRWRGRAAPSPPRACASRRC